MNHPRRHHVRVALALLLVARLPACGGPGPDDAGDATAGDAHAGGDSFDPDLDGPLIAARPYDLLVPQAYDGTPLPLVLTLHGLGWTADQHVLASGLIPLAEATPFLLAVPQALALYGTTIWNASLDGTLPMSWDDVHYLRALIADAASRYAVDRRRVYVTGVSNGAFMAHVLGCRAADRVAAIAAWAGTMWEAELASCQPAAPLAVLHSHGTADAVVPYDGGTFSVAFYSFVHASAPAVAELWRGLNGCDAASDLAPADYLLPAGDDTSVTAWQTGCAGGAAVELWTMPGAPHEPSFNGAYAQAVVDFLMAHPKAPQ